MEKNAKIENVHLHQDGFGRLYFDTCASDQEHMFAPVPEGDERRRCRKYMDNTQLFGEMIAKKVFTGVVAPTVRK